MNEDLSRARLHLAYKARILKRENKIIDTWVIDGRIKVKDLNNRIESVTSLKDLAKYEPPKRTPNVTN